MFDFRDSKPGELIKISDDDDVAILRFVECFVNYIWCFEILTPISLELAMVLLSSEIDGSDFEVAYNECRLTLSDLHFNDMLQVEQISEDMLAFEFLKL